MPPTADHAGVPIHPPLFFLSALLLGVVIDDRIRTLAIFTDDRSRWFGLIAVAIGIALIASGRKTMVKHGTNVNPSQPATTIVQSGPFRFSRNPLYVGLTLLYTGLAMLLNTWWSLLLLVPVSLVMHFLVVRREEAYLARKFGETYLDYCRR
ncbi:MAG: methyltransferase family protein, partial [Chthoniobacterales bacterium]